MLFLLRSRLMSTDTKKTRGDVFKKQEQNSEHHFITPII